MAPVKKKIIIKFEKFRAEAPIKILTKIFVHFCLLIDSVNTAV